MVNFLSSRSGTDRHVALVAQRTLNLFFHLSVVDAVPPRRMLAGKGAGAGDPWRWSGSFRAMRHRNRGNLGSVGNVESVTCRPHYPGDGTNPPLSAFALV